MNRIGVALIAGGLFGAGLAFSGMANPARVQGFLDLFGDWDPTLAFVMGGALIPMALAWMLQFDLPETVTLDSKLALGAVLFGAGWGLSGLCPGPAVANVAIAPLQVMPFILAMFGGMSLHRISSR
jgi:uncharacterized membrane protein YedE/YeeE